MKRIAVGQILQETNTLNPVATTRADFEAYGLVTGSEVVERYGDVGELAGFAALPSLLQEDIEWVGLCRAVAWSGGPLAGGLLAELTEAVLAPLRSTQVQGVLFSLHGAQAAVDDPDVSGHVLEAMRRQVGPHIPITASLDLHANLTPRMVESADVLLGYHTFPHTDHISCGARAARALAQLLGTSARPTTRAWKIPMVVNNEGRTTDRGVQRVLWRRIAAAETRDHVLSVGLFMVQPWLDVPDLGWSLYQCHWGDTPPLAFEEIGQQCWETRRHRETPYVRPEDLVAAARAIDGGPVAVSEGHDATNSGAPGDSTLLLQALLSEPIGEGGALVFCVDPAAVVECARSGEGASLDLRIGGHRDPFSDPLPVRARVESLGQLTYRLSGHGGDNLPVDMGRFARIRAGEVTVVLVEQTGPGSSPLLYETAGANPRNHKIVVAKSPEGFRQDYDSFASGVLYCAAPGCATPYLDTVSFARVTRPLYPIDDLQQTTDARWAGFVEPAANQGERPNG